MKKFALILSLTTLSACTVGPDFASPETPSQTAYTSEKDVLPETQRLEIGQQIQAQWWTVFASKPLDDAIHQAMADNNDIAAARERMAQAQEAVNAETGLLFPQVSLAGTAGKQKYGVALFGPSNFSIPPFAYYEVGPSVSWTLDIFGGTRRGIERQKALTEYQAHELDAAYLTLTGNVVSQALEIASAQAEIAAAQQIIDEDRQTLTLVQKTFQAGEGTKVEILSAQSQLDADQALLPPLQQRASVARHALAILLGKAPAEWTPPDFELANFTLPKALPVSLPSELVHRRPDILAAEANLHAASAAIGVATADLYPSVTLSASTLQEALTPAGLFKGVANAWALAGSVNVPLFSGGRGAAEVSAAGHAYQEALAQYKQTILQAFGQVADALTALAHDNDAVAAEQQAVDTAASSLMLARKSYQAGNTGLLQIEDAGRQLAQAQLGLIRAQRQRFLDTAQLFVALAGSPVAP